MTRVIVTPTADADVAAIITWLDAEAGHKIADRYVASFERLYDSLTSHPGIGAPRPKLGANIHIGVVPPYIVIIPSSNGKTSSPKPPPAPSSA